MNFKLPYEDVPPSLNALGSGDRRMYHRVKKRWQNNIIEPLLLTARVPRGLTHVSAHAVLTFDVERDRDEGNFRFFIEKALGDALVNGGWIEADTPDYYSFGRVVMEQGERKLTVIHLSARR